MSTQAKENQPESRNPADMPGNIHQRLARRGKDVDEYWEDYVRVTTALQCWIKVISAKVSISRVSTSTHFDLALSDPRALPGRASAI